MKNMKTTPQLTNDRPLDRWVIQHTHLSDVCDWLIDRIMALNEPVIMLVVGPTGAGKTTLLRVLKKRLHALLSDEMKRDRSRLATISAEAVFVPGRGPDWRALFQDLLADANDILPDRKIAGGDIKPGTSLSALHNACIQTIRHRRPAAVLLDEGGAFVEAGTKGALAKNLSFVKSISNRSLCHLVVLGDYSLVKLGSMNGQLNRRCVTVHLAPYGEAEADIFGKIVSGFQDKLRSSGIQCDLLESRSILHERSCGCVGLLARWVSEALIHSRRHNCSLNADVLRKTMAPDGAFKVWQSEINRGIAALREFEGKRD
jgi:energy-coupling factor transporter ATP-binding protein EcfA2